MRRLLLLACTCTVAFAALAQTERLTTAGNVRMTVNNIGLIGNAFRGSYYSLGYPSCEYPAGSGIEHLFEGGLWLGSKVRSQTRVTSGAIDASSGYSPGACNFEFTAPANAAVRTISSLVRNPGYNPLAISHQDFIADFTDRNTQVPGTTIQVDRGCNGTAELSLTHTPQNIDVHMETYNWNYSFANFFVILNYTIKNVGTDTLNDVAVGYWADGVVRNVRRTAPGGTPFFDKGGNGYVDSLLMGYEFDATGDPGYTDSYIGLKFLGADWYGKSRAGADSTSFLHPLSNAGCGTRPSVAVHYNTWQFNSPDPRYFTPRSEQDRYLRLTTGLNERPDWESQVRGDIRKPSNRSNLISLSGINRLAPGESITINFAVVLARKVEDGLPNTADTRKQKDLLVANGNWAQTTYNGEDRNFNGCLDPGEDDNKDGKLTRYVLPAPPDVPNARVEVGQNSATLYWSDNAEASVDPITRKKDFAGYRIYKTRTGYDMATVIDLTSSLDLYKTFAYPSKLPFVNPIPAKGTYVFEGDTTTYRYKLEIPALPAGWQHVIAITAYDSGNVATNLQPLESSLLDAQFRVFPGTPANADPKDNAPFAYPNPYYSAAAWERNGARPEERKLMFANLPARCRVRILTQAGDLVDEFTHDGSTYRGEDSQWYIKNSDTSLNKLSGGEHSWDLLSRNGQIIARGVYLFSVEDLSDGHVYKGKFTVIK